MKSDLLSEVVALAKEIKCEQEYIQANEFLIQDLHAECGELAEELLSSRKKENLRIRFEELGNRLRKAKAEIKRESAIQTERLWRLANLICPAECVCPKDNSQCLEDQWCSHYKTCPLNQQQS